MTLTRLELLRMQYRELVAPDADLRVPDGWVPLLDAYFDAVSVALAAGDLRLAFVLRETRTRGCLLKRRVEIGWTLPTSIRKRVDDAGSQLDASCLRTCIECGCPGACREVGGTLLVACEAHAEGGPMAHGNGDGT